MPQPDRGHIRSFYDRMGAKQDTQCWYEDPATADLTAHADFEHARAVFELGCGTGRFAAGLLDGRLPAHARYDAVDMSPTMLGLARERLAPFGDRVQVGRTDGALRFDRADAACDRFVANYVLDLLSEADIAAALGEAARLLADGGLLCIASLGHGAGPVSRAVAGLWSLIHRLRPMLVGGCRPLDLAPFIDSNTWTVRHRRTVVARGIPSEVIVAARRARAR